MDLWHMLGVTPQVDMALAVGGGLAACLVGLSRLYRRKDRSERLGLNGPD
jgi:hypothetical protein